MVSKMKFAALWVVKHNLLLLLALIGIILVQGVFTPRFFTVESMLNILLHGSYIGIVAIGVTLVILAGGIDISVGSVVAVSGCFLAGFQVFSGLPLEVALIGAISLAILAGALTGVLVNYVGIPPLIVTLAGLFIYRGVVLVYTEQTPISGLSPSLNFWGVGAVGGIPISVAIWLLIALIFHAFLKWTTYGEKLFAIGQSELVSRLSGINVRSYRFLTYVLCALLCGIAGILLTARLDSAQPTMGMAWEFEAIPASILGGTSLMGGVASIPNVVLGTLIITVIRTGLNMNGVRSEFQLVIVGFLLIIVVAIDALRHRLA